MTKDEILLIAKMISALQRAQVYLNNTMDITDDQEGLNVLGDIEDAIEAAMKSWSFPPKGES